ncbi:MAG: SBBP repeat-containing protein [Crocinitomicaceae bacterium]|nr:SBBP repeat-containing protein [Crocinitomicaceae bacterium]
MKTSHLILLFIFLGITGYSQVPYYEWGTVIGDAGYHDYCRSVIADSSGFAYVTGSFTGAADFETGAGTTILDAGLGDDFYLFKKSPQGDLIWAKQLTGDNFSGGTDMAFDSNNSMYITGYFSGTVDVDTGPGIYLESAYGGNDAFLMKVDTAGNLIWFKKFGGSQGDLAQAITIDHNDNIYITGNHYGSGDFDPGPGTLTLNGSNGLCVFVVKLDTSGQTIWAKEFVGPGEASCQSIDTDSEGNVYTAGTFSDTVDFDPGLDTLSIFSHSTNPDIFINKLTQDGAFVWVHTFGNPPKGDYCRAMTCTKMGEIWLSGHFTDTVDFDPGPGVSNLISVGGPNDQNAFLLKLDTAGNYILTQHFADTSSLVIWSMSSDSLGNIYITGKGGLSTDYNPGPGVSTSSYSAFVEKLNAAGNMVWILNWTENGVIKNHYLDQNGNLFVCGNVWGGADVDPGPAYIFMDGESPSTMGSKNLAEKFSLCESSMIPSPDSSSLQNLTFECSVDTIIPPTALHDCDGVIYGIPNISFPIDSLGTHVITWTYDDGYGNVTTQAQNIEITPDASIPVPDLFELPDIIEQCSVFPTPPSATDNCDGIIYGIADVTFPITSQGTTVITWTYSDSSGNSVTQNQNVILQDTTPPTATTPPVEYFFCPTDVPLPDPGILANVNDNCGSVVVTHLSDSTNGSSCNNEIIYRKYLLTDNVGNQTIITQEFHLTSFNPSVGAGSDQTVCPGDSVALTAINPYGVNISWNNNVTDGVYFIPSDTLNMYTVTADLCSGYCSNSDSVLITVIDTTPPTGSAPTLTVPCPSDIPTPSSNAISNPNDNCGNVNIVHLTDSITGTVCNNETVYRKYLLSDDSGNETIVTQLIFVQAATPTVDAGINKVICYGDSTTLYAYNPDNANISWNYGVIDGVAFIPAIPGGMTNTYVVTAEVCGGLCSNSDSMTITVIYPDPAVSVNDTILTAIGLNSSYQWLDCNENFTEIPGATSNIFSPSVNGNYAVEVINGNCIDTSDCYQITGIVSSKDYDLQNNFEIFPNPNPGYLTINNKGNDVYSIKIYSIHSKLLYEGNSISEKLHKVNMDYPNGSYYLEISVTNEAIIRKKIILMR